MLLIFIQLTMFLIKKYLIIKNILHETKKIFFMKKYISPL